MSEGFWQLSHMWVPAGYTDIKGIPLDTPNHVVICTPINWTFVRENVQEANPSFPVVLFSPMAARTAIRGMRVSGYTISHHHPFARTEKEDALMRELIMSVLLPAVRKSKVSTTLHC